MRLASQVQVSETWTFKIQDSLGVVVPEEAQTVVYRLRGLHRHANTESVVMLIKRRDKMKFCIFQGRPSKGEQISWVFARTTF